LNLVRSLCQGCRSLSRIVPCPGCITLTWMYFAKMPDWPRRKAVAEFRLCVSHDSLGTHLHRNGIRPDPYCMLCSLREPMGRIHLGQCTALFNRTECERYWEVRAKKTENWICSFLLLFLWLLFTVRTFIFWYL